MNEPSKKFALHFLTLMLCVFVLFFLSVGLTKPVSEALIYMNDPAKSKSAGEWFLFLIGGGLSTAVWGILWVLFKHAEKQCTEMLFKK